MRWSDIGDVGFAYTRIRHILPRSLKKSLDRRVPRQIPTQKQLAEIETLGKGIGLDVKEIYAATNLEINNVQLTKRWLTPLTIFVMIITIIILSFVILIVAGIYPRPPTIYGAGPRYGSIKPRDFISY